MKMIEDFESHETRSSGELWSEICSSLPDVQEEAQGQEGDDATLFTDSFQPSHVGNGLQSNGMSTSSSSHSAWEPMEDSDVYIASLENRLKRIKGQCTEVTSREMLRSLSQAKKECWDRFLHDAQSSELFQEGELDQRERQDVVQGHAKVIFSLGWGHRGVVDHDGEVLERAGLSQEEEQLLLVELEVVG
uniref:Coiled-coil domain containing 32 n=1 Tax=Oncorhynchus tshawytscha TaxID=74940 RepID=A0A8C8FQT6_ONCTS